MQILDKYTTALEATLGAIAAFRLVNSKDSSKTVRDCSKAIDNLSVELRRTLVEADKQLVVSND